jgi:radical SAM protein with 4Fe4S-binding SPASM domain
MLEARSRIPGEFIFKELAKIMLSDWGTFSSGLGLQLAKETFNLRNLDRGRSGQPDKLRQVSLRITDMCNLRCHTCGQWGDNGYLLGESLKDLKKREVPVETYKKFVDDILKQGWSPLWYIWGGEPMMYPNLLELMHYIADRKMPITMVTNGTHVAERVDDIMDTCKILWLSIDGPNAEIHNQQRPGVSSKTDNFKAVKAALETISEEKKRRKSVFPFVVPISVIARYNIDYLADLYKFTSQYADAHIFYLSWWIDEQSAQAHNDDFNRRFGFEPHTHWGWVGTWKNFDHGIIFDKFEEMRALSNQIGRCPPLMYPRLKTREQVSRYYEDHNSVFGFNQCVSIYMTMEVDSNGDVSLCRDYHDYIIGNIKTDPVTKIWHSEAARKFRSSIATDGLMPVCTRCCGLMGY